MKKLLAVNDVKIFTEFLQSAFAEMSIPIHIDPVLSGGKAVEAIKSGAWYDVILMNLEMDRLHGTEATKIIRSHGFEGPIIAWSCHAKDCWEERCLAHGMNGFAEINGGASGLVGNVLVELEKHGVL